MFRRAALAALLLAGPAFAQAPRKVVLIAGPKSHGPVGNGIHDYGWSVKLLKTMLEHSNIKDRVRVEIHLDGWPKQPKTLEDADTIMVISDGRDGDQYQEAPHLASPERVRFLAAQVKRGCGFLTFHFSTFAPQQYAREVLDWSGGYFQWEQNGKRQWYSAITTKEAAVEVATPDHPVARGLKPFTLREEFYYNLRFPENDRRVKPIWTVPSLPGREPDGRVVAWARERPDGGRGFGTTCGHFYDNWKQEQFRKLILNAIAWTARVEVPPGGVEARYFTHEEIDRHLEPPIRVLMLTGNDAHKWHNWEKSTAAIRSALERDPRILVDVIHDPEEFARRKLTDYAVIVQNNYANWLDLKPLSDAAKKAFVEYLQNGGGLVLIHFANGAWHFSLPKAGESDWPEYRKIVRRVWNHNGNPPSGHDPFGRFLVEPTKVKHSITAGLKPFEIDDELYFRQDGSEPIEPLLTARSRVTRRDEPLAFAYSYGMGRVFQTLLGHSEKTYDAYEPREMLRRAVAWCAGREVRPIAPSQAEVARPQAAVVAGRFGNALDARAGGAFVAGRREYREPPLTAECWARVSGKDRYHIFLANELKSSATHWELFAEARNGCLTAYLPGHTPDHVRSKVDVTDGRWHHLRLILEPARVRLTVDGKVVADAAVKFTGGKTVEGRFAIGSLAGKEIGCGGLVDEVHLMRGVPESLDVPAKPRAASEKSVGLWHLDKLENGKFADESSLKNAATFEAIGVSAAPAGPTSPDRLDYAPVDPKWHVVLIDHSADDAYTGVKVDSQGQVFVGGREGLWVFEPDGRGRYRPRQELYRFPKDSIIIGIEVRGNDLYVLTSSALYLFPEGRVKRAGLKPKRLLWGLPLDLHVSFHCLAWGPEGDLYLNHGDPLLNYGDYNRPDHWGHWTYYLADGSKVPYTGVGAVLRMKPDGTGLKVVATGLRGPVGLCFDKNWNLFTNDNDHESIPDRYGYVKLLHVVEGVDFGWPRGWMASKSPERSDLIEPMVPSMGRGVPVGLAYVDEPALGLTHQLLQARWDQRAIRRYPITPRGSSFVAEELPFLDGQHVARPTGLCAGRGGRLFATVHYLAGNVHSPHCVSDLVMILPAGDVPAGWMDLTKADVATLRAELTSEPWQRRLEAHHELLRRGLSGMKVPAARELTVGDVIKQAASDDLYLRQVATRFLARNATLAQIEALMADRAEPVRRAGVLAAGIRLTVPPSDFVPPPEVKLSYTSGNAFFALQYAEEPRPIDLRTLARVGSFTFAEYWKAIRPNPEQDRLVRLLAAALADASEPVQLQAANYLTLLGDPGWDRESQISAAKRAVARVRAKNCTQEVARVWVVGPIDAGLKDPRDRYPEDGPVDLTAAYGRYKKHWIETDLARVNLELGEHGPFAYTYFRLQSRVRQTVVLPDLSPPIWHNGARVDGLRDVPMRVDLQPGSNDILTSFSAVPKSIRLLVEEPVAIVLPDRLDSAELAKRLREAKGDETVPPEFLAVNWAEEVRKGDVANGRRLFGTLACAKCHAIAAGQKGAGAPSLTDAARRFTVPHVVESILLPSKQVAEPFRGSRIELKNGQTVAGLVVAETAEQIEVLLSDGTRKTVARADIEERKITSISPMPAGLVKTPAELRDLLAYLFSDRPVPP